MGFAFILGSCVPGAELDPCLRCEGACEASLCAPAEVARFDGSVRFLDVDSAGAYACVEGAGGFARLVRASVDRSDRGSQSELAAVAGLCAGLVVRPEEEALYVGFVRRSEKEPPSEAYGVFRMALPSGPLVRVLDRCDLSAFDARGGEVFAVESGMLLGPASLGFVPTLRMMPAGEQVIARISNDGTLYVGERFDARISRLSGGGLSPIFNGGAQAAPAIHLHDFRPFGNRIVASHQGEVLLIDPSLAEPPVPLITGMIGPVTIRESGRSMVLADHGSRTLVALRFAGEPSLLANELDVTALALHDGFVYFTDAVGTLSRVPLP